MPCFGGNRLHQAVSAFLLQAPQFIARLTVDLVEVTGEVC